MDSFYFIGQYSIELVEYTTLAVDINISFLMSNRNFACIGIKVKVKGLLLHDVQW